MEGVEILATEQVAIAFGFDWVLFVFMTILLGITIGGIVWFLAEGGNFSNLATGICVSGALVIALAMAIAIASDSKSGTPTEFETHYKVTISDEVSMNEFLGRYEIVDQDGKIFVVRERTNP